MVVKSGHKRARHVSRVWFRGVEVDISQLTYADVRRGILRGYCIDEHGAKHGDYDRGCLQTFEARGRIRLVFRAKHEDRRSSDQLRLNLYRLGVGAAVPAPGFFERRRETA